jgi:hypothetical protein
MGATTVKFLLTIGKHKDGCQVHLNALQPLFAKMDAVNAEAHRHVTTLELIYAKLLKANPAPGAADQLMSKDAGAVKAQQLVMSAMATYKGIAKEAETTTNALQTPLSNLKTENQKFKEYVNKKKASWIPKSKKSVPEAELCITETSKYVEICDNAVDKVQSALKSVS